MGRVVRRWFGRPRSAGAALLLGVLVAGAVWAARWSRHRPSPPPGHFVEQLEATTFQRGNLHTHTNMSDGDRPPEEVARWYRDHGYAFLAITDHNRLTDPADLASLEGPGFVLVPGEEVTMRVGSVPVHVNALCHRETIGGGDFPSAEAAFAWAIPRIRAQGGIALVNHPNFEWALSAADLRHAEGARLLEIWSGHPFVRSEGDAFHPSHEALWDKALSSGQIFAGVGVDDMHYLSATPADPVAGPGRAWVEVFSAELSRPAICSALDRGRLYASNGAALRRVAVTADTLSVEPAEPGALVEFIGKDGEVLESARPTQGAAATYRLAGGEVYVRARITRSDGKRAWTQAYRVGP